MRNDIKVRYGYKIHGFKTANGRAQSSNTQKFYETYDDALDAAINMTRRHNAGNDGIVIYKAVMIVRTAAPPVELVPVELDS